jgi:predicted nucleic acid-binding protein
VRLYLDTSVYNRPFDDQSQPRIWLETLALALVLQMVETGQADLVTSTVLEYENSRNPFPLRRRWVDRCLALAIHRQVMAVAIGQRAEELANGGLTALDALHVACAEAAESDHFLTCDDRLVARCRGLSLPVLNPVDFVRQTTGGTP